MQHWKHGALTRREAMFCLWAAAPSVFAQSQDEWSDEQRLEFLSKAKLVKSKGLSAGVTNSIRATLEKDGTTHDAHVQTIHESKSTYQTPLGTEFNFKDWWEFNIAAYRVDRLLNLNLTPATISRRFEGRGGSYTWWMPDCIVERERLEKHLEPPDKKDWADQMYMVRVFDQLIYNTDRNLGNLLIDKQWRIWTIDHTRAFRIQKTLKTPADLVMCEQGLFAQLQKLTAAEVTKSTEGFLSKGEVDGLMARRDLIVAAFQQKAASQGEGTVFYTYGKRR